MPLSDEESCKIVVAVLDEGRRRGRGVGFPGERLDYMQTSCCWHRVLGGVVCVCVCVLLEVEGVVDDVGDWWSSGRLRSRRRGGGKLCMLLQSCTALPALVVAKCGRRMRQMPMTTKDPRRVRHWRHRSTGGRGRCDVPPHSLLRRGYKSWLYLSQTGLTHPHGQGTRVGPSCWGQKAAICTMPCAR